MATTSTPTIGQAAAAYKNVCGIYEIRHTNADVAYIGQSIDVGERLTRHLYELRNGLHKSGRLQTAWKMGGSESFTATLLESCTPALLDAREQHWLKLNPSALNEQMSQRKRGLSRPKHQRTRVVAEVRCLVSLEEHGILESAARLHGRSVSVWARGVLVEAARAAELETA